MRPSIVRPRRHALGSHPPPAENAPDGSVHLPERMAFDTI